jgi:hypothetical protein
MAGARTALISDATPPLGAPHGRYEMAGVPIERAADGAAHTRDGRRRVMRRGRWQDQQPESGTRR